MGKYDLDGVSVNYDIHERELKERQYLIESCPINIYSMSINPRWSYPYKLMSYWETRPAVANSCESLIIDSGYRRYGELEPILTETSRFEAEWFIPPDVTPDFDCYEQIRPADRAHELHVFLDEAADRGLADRLLAPLHRPLGRQLDTLQDHPNGNLLARVPGVAMGLKSLPVAERQQALLRINQATGPTTHVHALSPGTELEMLGFLRENPHLVDSLDVSTPESAAGNNKVPDETWHQHVVPFPGGDDVSTLRAMRSMEIVLRLNHMLSDLCNDEEFRDVASQPAPADD